MKNFASDIFTFRKAEEDKATILGKVKSSISFNCNALSRQIVLTILRSLGSNPKKSQRVIFAFMKMMKIYIETLVNVKLYLS